MSSQISNSGLRIASALVSANGADFNIAASEGVPTPPADGYIPISERDPRQNLKAVVNGEQTADPKARAAKEEDPYLTAKIWGVAVFILGGISYGLYQAYRHMFGGDSRVGIFEDNHGDMTGPKPELKPEMKQAETEALRAKLADASYLLDILPERRNRIVEKWQSLSPEQRRDVIEAEFQTTMAEPIVVPKLPPPAWSAELGRILEGMAEQRADLSSKEGLLAEATRIRSDAIAYTKLLLLEDAALAHLSAARAFEGVEGKRFNAIGAYRDAAVVADMAGKRELANAAHREADRLFIEGRLAEALKGEPELAKTFIPTELLARRLASKIVVDETIRGLFVDEVDHASEDRFASPPLKGSWRKGLLLAVREIEEGLAPDWRQGIVEFVYGKESPEYREFQGEWWYKELVDEEVKDIARLVLQKLDDPLSRESFVEKGLMQGGRVTAEGLKLLIEEAKAHIGTASPAPQPAVSESSAVPAKKGLNWETIDPRLKFAHERIRVLWDAVPKNGILLGAALENDEPIVEIGKYRDLIPASFIKENATPEELRLLLPAEESPEVTPLVPEAIAAPAKEGLDWENIEPQQKLVHERILELWDAERGNNLLLDAAVENDERIVKIGREQKRIPVSWIQEHFSQMELAAISFPGADVAEKVTFESERSRLEARIIEAWSQQQGSKEIYKQAVVNREPIYSAGTFGWKIPLSWITEHFPEKDLDLLFSTEADAVDAQPAVPEAIVAQAKEGLDWENIDPQQKLVHERILELWNAQRGNNLLLDAAIENDEQIVRVGSERKRVPASFIKDHLTQEDLALLMPSKADPDAPKVAERRPRLSEGERERIEKRIALEFSQLSKAKQRAYRKNSLGDMKQIGKDSIPGLFYDERLNAIENGEHQAIGDAHAVKGFDGGKGKGLRKGLPETARIHGK